MEEAVNTMLNVIPPEEVEAKGLARRALEEKDEALARTLHLDHNAGIDVYEESHGGQRIIENRRGYAAIAEMPAFDRADSERDIDPKSPTSTAMKYRFV
mmetsp:Transcript_5584/g.8887  ORF Transcript_5584/g.8887 Transcript_5584/m.8887 type:complete len:99 (-) Transcript_5584:107-403(-)